MPLHAQVVGNVEKFDVLIIPIQAPLVSSGDVHRAKL